MPSRTLLGCSGLSLFSLLALSATGRRDRHFANVSIRGDEPAASCNDLKIEFRRADAVMQSEERMVTKAEAPTLRATGRTMAACRFADGIRRVPVDCARPAAPYPDADKILAKLGSARSTAKIHVSGPLHDEIGRHFADPRAEGGYARSASEQWAARNYSVEGRITAKAVNGRYGRDCKAK